MKKSGFAREQLRPQTTYTPHRTQAQTSTYAARTTAPMISTGTTFPETCLTPGLPYQFRHSYPVTPGHYYSQTGTTTTTSLQPPYFSTGSQTGTLGSAPAFDTGSYSQQTAMNIGLSSETAQGTTPQQPTTIHPTTASPFLPVCTRDLSSTFLGAGASYRGSAPQTYSIPPNIPYSSHRGIQTTTTVEQIQSYANVAAQAAQQHQADTREANVKPSAHTGSAFTPSPEDITKRVHTYPVPVFLPQDMRMEKKLSCYKRLEILIEGSEELAGYSRPLRTMGHVDSYDPTTQNGTFKFVIKPTEDALECARWTARFKYDQVEKAKCYSGGKYYHTESADILTGMKAFFSLNTTTNENGKLSLEARSIVFDY